jgi:predicted lactoylglutathione lyase
MAKLIFINLPVSDLVRATAFYQAIGAVKNTQFSDDTASCMVFSDMIHAMLMTHDKYRQFTTKKIADAKTTSQVLICISADSRAEVDDLVSKAGSAGGVIDPSPQDDYDFMAMTLSGDDSGVATMDAPFNLTYSCSDIIT